VNTVVSTAGDAAIWTRGLRKSFGEKTVLDGIEALTVHTSPRSP
jgi:hypothetical protein